MQSKFSLAQIFIVVMFLAALAYFGYRFVFTKDDGKLRASGTIEAVEVDASPETSGKIKEVLADEGQTVKMGEPLFRLDDSLLAAQRAVAAAQLDTANAGVISAQNALNTAKAQYQITLDTALEQDKTTRLQDWFSEDPGQFDQPRWYFTRVEQIQAVQGQVDLNQKELEDAQANLANVTQSLGQTDFLKAEKRLLDARLAYLVAKDVYNRTQNATSSNDRRVPCDLRDRYHVVPARLTNVIYKCTGDPSLSNAGNEIYDKADAELTSAQKAYNDLLDTQAANEVLQARADVSVAQEQYYSSIDVLNSLQTGDQSESVTAAKSTLDQAQAAVDQAQKSAQQAQANLDLLDTQMEKLTVSAPMDGVILTRNVEPGGFVQPGGAALTMANLNDLTITVYIPEDRYGEIHLGQEVSVSVDSFPGQTFNATVNYIADQAEFTPRNVQTVQGRSATVYAVKLKVSDPEGKLKLGMPADVVFTN
jgi:HlyD family secretion protein